MLKIVDIPVISMVGKWQNLPPQNLAGQLGLILLKQVVSGMI